MKHGVKIFIATLFLLGSSSVALAGEGQGMKSNAGETHTPENIQRSTPSGEKPLSSGSGPGTRADELTELEDVDAKNLHGKSHASGKKNTPEDVQRSTPSGEKSLPSGGSPGSREDQLTEMDQVDPKDPQVSLKDGKSAKAVEDLMKKNKDGKVSSQSSSKKSH